MAETRPDFPYIDGRPTAIDARGWTVILAACALAFLQLVLLPLTDMPWNFVPAIVFTGLPVLALMAVTGWRAPAIFRPLGIRQIVIGLGFGLLTIIASFIAGIMLSWLISMAPNSQVAALGSFGTIDLLLFLARTFIQLVGEELVTILPLLAVLWLCVTHFGLGRRRGLVIAVVVSTLWFSALHLPTYDWNVLQCVLTIGTARLVLTAAYLLTRNIWVSSIAHITNDWSLFFFAFLYGHGPIEPGV